MKTSSEYSGSIWLRMMLLRCGIISSILYVAMNVFIPMTYQGYDASSQAVSELSAINAPTRAAWVFFGSLYSFLVIGFGSAIRSAAGKNKQLRITGTLVIIYAIIGLFWPPMHQREVIAAGGGTLTDTLHIVFTFITVPLMLGAVGFSAAALGKKFAFYAIIIIATEIFFGVLTAQDAPNLEAGLPTPYMGIWERISIGAQMIWVAALSIILMRRMKTVNHEIPIAEKPEHPFSGEEAAKNIKYG